MRFQFLVGVFGSAWQVPGFPGDCSSAALVDSPTCSAGPGTDEKRTQHVFSFFSKEEVCVPVSLVSTHPAPVHGVHFSCAPVGQPLIFLPDLLDDSIQVQLPVVVHGQNNVSVPNKRLQLGQLLRGKPG